MKSNSKVIGVVVCIVCCIGALCILPLVTTNESDLTGWNPSSVYDGVISPSTSVFTDAVLEESNGGGMATTPRVSSTGSRMFHHTGASSVSMSAGATTSSYAGASVHTTSSAMMGGTGSSISPISTSTARSSMGGGMNGGGAIYATSSSTSSRSNAGGSIMSTGGSATAPTASRAMSPMMSAASSSSNPTTSLYAGNMTSNYGSASYGGYSGRRGISGAMRAPGTIGGGTSGNDVYAWYNAWLHDLVEHEGTGWLYGKEIGYFSEEGLKQAWEEAMAALKAEGAMPTWWDESYDWDHFWTWFTAYGGENSYSESYANEFYRLSIPDGIGVLFVLSLLCALFTFLRSRDKKAEAVEEQQS